MPPLMQLLGRINKRILQRVRLPDEIHGSRKGHSIKTFATPHRGKPTVLRLDIKSFFPSVRPDRICRLFRNLDCSWEVANTLTRLTTYRHQLPQGAPTSPTLANLVLVDSGLYERLRGFAESRNLDLGFYVDDIQLSGAIEPRRFKRLLLRIVAECGLRVNMQKLDCQFSRLAHERQEALGLTINDKVNPSKDYVRTLRATLHACRTKGVVSQTPEGMTPDQFRRSLLGKIQYVRWLNPRLGEKYVAECDRLKAQEVGASAQ